MPQTIKLKRSAVNGQVPTTAQLELGEVAINTYDGKVYIKKNDGADSIVEIQALPSGTAGSFYRGATQPSSALEGDLWYDTANDTLMFYNGTAWAALAGSSVQTAVRPSATAPTTRPDTTALQAGDSYYNTTDENLYIHDGTAWRLNSWYNIMEPKTTNPTARDNGEALEPGDMYYNTTNDVWMTYDGTGWNITGGTAESARVSASDPLTRSDGSTLGIGDMYYNSTDESLYIHDGTDWRLNSWFNVIEPRTTDPTTRDNGEALEEGDMYYNTTSNAWVSYTGSAWVEDEERYYGEAAAAPTARRNGTAIQVGDIYYNTAEENLYIREPGGTWSLHSWYNIIEPRTTDPTTRDNGRPLEEGDQYYNTTDNMPYAYDGSAWNPMGGGAVISDTEPSVKTDGMLWMDTVNGGMYTWNAAGSTWIGVTNLGV